MEEKQVELIDYLRVLWRQKWVIAVTFVAAVVAAWGALRTIPPTYETQTSLLLLPPLSSQLDAEAVGSRLPPEAYQEFSVSTSLLQSVRERAGLPESMTVGNLKKRLSVSVKRLSSKGELLLSTTITGSDPDQLPDIATAWTEAFADTYGELFQDRIARSYDYVSENYAETEAELERVLEEQTQLLLVHPLKTLRARLNALQQEETSNQARLTEARREYHTTVVLVAALEEELALQPFTHTLSSSIAPGSLVAALIGAGLTAREIEALADVESKTEFLNTTYIDLEARIATQRALLRALEEEIRVREEDAAVLREELATRGTEITESEAALDEYDRRIRQLESSSSKLASSLQDAKIALAETPDPIRVIDEPLVPRSPIAPKKTTNIAIAGFLGLMMGTLLAFLVDYLARVRKQESNSVSPEKEPLQAPRDHKADENAKPERNEYREEPPTQ